MKYQNKMLSCCDAEEVEFRRILETLQTVLNKPAEVEQPKADDVKEQNEKK